MLRRLFARPTEQDKTPKPMIIVSGLPRSGTSMLMKMLAEGGVPVLTDELRSADTDNPNGYYEFEPVKQLPQHKSGWLADGKGKAVKIISALLEYLPGDTHYKVIFVEREIEEVLASQQKMLARRDESSGIDDAAMQKQFEEHLAAVKYWLARQPNIDVLYVEYGAILADPEGRCREIAGFIGRPLEIEKMSAVPSAHLYRNRAK
jgi:LPS sulfotransferase NodH